MLSLFKSKPLLSQSDIEFQVATFTWLLKNFGGDDFYKTTKLVLPTREYFPSKVDTPEGAASETFETVKKHAGLENWMCKLEIQEEDANPVVAPTLAIQNAPTSPHGTFQATEDNEIVITYNPALASQPTQLVATFAHELAHYLTATSKEEPPGGWENWEFATDIAATFIGFGVFMANSAFSFSQYTNSDSQGWKSSRNGYLSESEHIHALAIFNALKGISVELASGHLKPHLKKLLKKAHKELDNSGIVEELRAVAFDPSTHIAESEHV
jgi:hypothetical protein